MVKIIKLFVVFMTIFFFSVSEYSYSEKSQPGACASLLPDPAVLALKKKYPGWRILNSDDLDAEDRETWNRTHPGECPSIAIGQYERKNKDQYAVLLISAKKAKTLKVKLVMLKMIADTSFIHQVLYDDKALITNYPVIYKAGPGQYVDFYDPDNKVEVTNDAVIYNYIGTSALAFYFADGKYNQVLISD